MRGVKPTVGAAAGGSSSQQAAAARIWSQSGQQVLLRPSSCGHVQYRNASCRVAPIMGRSSLTYSWAAVDQVLLYQDSYADQQEAGLSPRLEANPVAMRAELQRIQQGAAAVRSPYKPDMQDRHVTLMDVAQIACDHLGHTPTTYLPQSPPSHTYQHANLGIEDDHDDDSGMDGMGGMAAAYNYFTPPSPAASIQPCTAHASQYLAQPGWDMPSCMIGVFDGHSGTRSATYSATRMGTLLASDARVWTALMGAAHLAELEPEVVAAVKGGICRAFITLDKEILQEDRFKPPGEFDGTTALMGLQVGHHLFVANLGDTRAVLSRGGEAVRLSRDHTPQMADERRRIESAGGAVRLHKGIWRLVLPLGTGLGHKICSVSRALGDIDYKEPRQLMTAIPDVFYWPLTPHTDRFAIYASDGVWAVIDDQQAVDTVQAALDKARAQGFTPEQCAEHAAVQLVSTALDFGSYDDITAVVTPFTWAGPHT